MTMAARTTNPLATLPIIGPRFEPDGEWTNTKEEAIMAELVLVAAVLLPLLGGPDKGEGVITGGLVPRVG
jgi:hypothetical protein